jgi:hypothetical protein
VAKDKEAFYLIEVKTRLSKYKRSSKGPLRQLLKQKAGLRRIISIFTNEKLNLKLIIIEYVRDRSKVLVKYINSSGAIERTKDLNLKVD